MITIALLVEEDQQESVPLISLIVLTFPGINHFCAIITEWNELEEVDVNLVRLGSAQKCVQRHVTGARKVH